MTPALVPIAVVAAETALFPNTMSATSCAQDVRFIGCEKPVICVSLRYDEGRVRVQRDTLFASVRAGHRLIAAHRRKLSPSHLVAGAIMSDDDSSPCRDRRSRCAPDCIFRREPASALSIRVRKCRAAARLRFKPAAWLDFESAATIHRSS